MNPKITLIGRVGQNPEKIGNGIPGIRFRVVTSDAVKTDRGWEDKDTSWWTVKAWRTVAQQAMQTLQKGNEVMITGTIAEDSWTDSNGNKRSTYEVTADYIGLTTFTLTKEEKEKPEPVYSGTNPEDPWKK